jgi:hypothetical protein
MHFQDNALYYFLVAFVVVLRFLLRRLSRPLLVSPVSFASRPLFQQTDLTSYAFRSGPAGFGAMKKPCLRINLATCTEIGLKALA